MQYENAQISDRQEGGAKQRPMYLNNVQQKVSGEYGRGHCSLDMA